MDRLPLPTLVIRSGASEAQIAALTRFGLIMAEGGAFAPEDVPRVRLALALQAARAARPPGHELRARAGAAGGELAQD